MPIVLTETHNKVWAKYGKVIGYGFDQARADNHNRGGLHRLAHLSPEIVPTQEELATILAELALNQVMERMMTSYDAIVIEMFNEAKIEEQEGRNGFDRLLQLTKGKDWKASVAYDAIVMMKKEDHRLIIKKDSDGKSYKDMASIPEIVSAIAGLPRPPRPRGRRNPAEGPFFDGGIVLMIHVASESALNPTRNRATATQACTDIVCGVINKHFPGEHFSEKTIHKKWEKRSNCYPSKLSLLP